MKTTNLLNQIADLDNLSLAWRQVRRNIAASRRATSYGVDQVSVAAFEQQWEANLAELGAALLEGRYRPLPVRKVEIPKPGGASRTIGVLAVRDRIAQRAAQQVLEPVFEDQFLDCSYGFRPGRSVNDAVHRVLCYRQAGCTWVFDADVASCFDSLDHGLLLQFVGETVREEAVLDLIHDWLETGLLTVDASLQQQDTLWERIVDRAVGAIRGQSYGTTPLLTAGESTVAENYDQDWSGGTSYGGDWQRRSLWKSVRSDLLLLGLTSARPVLRNTSTRLRRLARRRGVKWAIAGAAGAAALGGAWWTLQRIAPKGVGTLQGSALSPLLANVYLHHFDQHMSDRSRNLVRYADDMVVCCRDQVEALEAAQEAAHALADLRLRLNPDKSKVVSFNQGFRFLGQRFQGEGLVPSPAQRVRQAVNRGIKPKN